MWKFFILTLLIIGLSEAKFELKGRTRQRLKQTLEAECEKYGQRDKAEQISDAAWNAVICFYSSAEVEGEFSKKVEKEDRIIEYAKSYCKYRREFLTCTGQLLDAMTPCAGPSVKEQVENMKLSFASLLDYICADDVAKVRRFVADGNSCDSTKSNATCFRGLNDILTEFPEDTSSFKAIDTCHRYDAMVTCVSEDMRLCLPEDNPSVEFVKTVLAMVRKGTYCHVTLPLEETHVEDNKV